MKISVVIPCRNSAPYLERTLRSVADQRHQPYEVILVDDGSTDDSVTIARNSGIVTQLLSSNWRNGAGTRNVGIAAATGDWIAFLDADDYWLPNHLEQFVQMNLPAKTVCYISHRRYQLADNSRSWENPPPYNLTQPEAALSDREFLERFLQTGFQFCMPTVLIRRQRLLEVGMLDSTQIRRHDIEMWLRVLAGHCWAFHPVSSLVCQADTPGSISRNVVNCAYWFYQAMKKNEKAYAGATMSAIVSKAAQSACATALTEGSSADFRMAYSAVRGDLRPWKRCLFAVGGLYPSAFAALNRFRRKIM